MQRASAGQLTPAREELPLMGALRSAAVLTAVSSETTERAPDAGLQRDRSRRESALGDCVSIFVWSWLVRCADAWGCSPTQPAVLDGPSQEAGPPAVHLLFSGVSSPVPTWVSLPACVSTLPFRSGLTSVRPLPAPWLCLVLQPLLSLLSSVSLPGHRPRKPRFPLFHFLCSC